LKKVDSYSQASFVEKGGWATTLGADSAVRVSAVAGVRASLLTTERVAGS